MSITKRFWEKVDIPFLKSNTCWMWTGCQNKARGGYGMFYYDRKRGREWAHRVVWELVHSIMVLKGYYVLHRCDNPPCVNPMHLELGKQHKNMKDAWDRGRIKRANMVKAANIRWGNLQAIS